MTMQVEIKVPQLSESVSEATLGTWHKKAGEAVTEGDNLIDIETDKVVLELPAIKSGMLTKLLKNDGDKVVSNEAIALLEVNEESTADLITQPNVKEKQSVSLPASPKQAATDHYMKDDALPAVKVGSVQLVDTTSRSMAGERIEQRIPMTRIRQRIAERLLQSQQNAAILTTFNEVNMLPVIELRNRYREAFEKKHGVKLGFMSFFVKAALIALNKFPVVNASVDGTDIVYHDYYDIGVAISTERGLSVPVIRDAHKLSLADIEKKIIDFSVRARNGKVTLEELTGGTFSISNGGVFGSMLSTPIINPPQSAILGVHATQDRPVAENGQVVIRPMNYLALSYDHRIVDGRDAVLFLASIKEALEHPEEALLDL